MLTDLSQLFCALYIDVCIEVETQRTTSPNPTEIIVCERERKDIYFICMISTVVDVICEDHTLLLQ
jgi:hypothetical protein